MERATRRILSLFVVASRSVAEAPIMDNTIRGTTLHEQRQSGMAAHYLL